MPRRQKPEAFDVKLSADERKQLANDWSREIRDAESARSAMIADGGLIDLYDWFYEQGRSDPSDRPFPGAADLTSYFFTENIDALRARLMKTVFGVEPFCLVEGWGQSADRVGYVEEFHEWQVKDSGLKSEMGKVIHGALIEDCYILEVSEKIETRRITENIDAALELVNGAAVFENGQPKLRMDAYGEPVEAKDGEASAKVERTYTKTKRLGPQYEGVSMKDFLFLPGHAKNRQQLWGYAKRLWKRVPELEEQAKDGIYDKDAVKMLGQQSDRETSTAPTTSDIAPQTGPTVEKELWQLSVKADLDNDGREEWYLATLSVNHTELLRLKLDKFVMKVGKPRCVPFVLCPRRDSNYGYAYAGDKLLTLAEEHTALRNMRADRSALKTNAPMTVLQGALWDPDAEPIGVGRTIRVRQHDEVRQLEIEDVPSSIVQQLQDLVGAKERVGGLADSAVGVLSMEHRTLGENRLAAGGSAVRVDEMIGYLHLAIADVMALSHAIWVESLEADPRGLEAPASVTQNLELRGSALQDGRFTAAQLKGQFQFKPYGSAETADPEHMLANFNNGLVALGNIAKVFPQLQVIFQSREAAKAILEEWVRVYKVRNRQPFLGAFMQAGTMPPAVGTGPAAPVAAEGAPGGIPPEIAALMSGAGAPPVGGGAGAY